MKKEFVSYDQALALKELGFDEEVFQRFTLPDMDEFCKHPLKQQVFRWFRDKHNLSSFCKQVNKEGKSYWKIDKIDTEDKIKGYSAFTKSYSEAEDTCIDKLIEIVKQNNKK